MTKNRRDLGVDLRGCQHGMSLAWSTNVLAVFDEELQVDFEDGLEQAHVGTLVQSDLVFPDVDDEDLARGKRKEGALAFKVLVLSSLSAVGTHPPPACSCSSIFPLWSDDAPART
jgi:hypothetical protein